MSDEQHVHNSKYQAVMEEAEKAVEKLLDEEDVIVYTEEDIRKCEAMMEAAQKGDKAEVERLVDTEDADACYQREADGVSALMVAAKAGHKDIVQFLLDCGCPWNQQDREGKCAGEYGWAGVAEGTPGCQECVDLIMEWGIRAELILGSIQSDMREEADPDGQAEDAYLSDRVAYDEGMTRLVDSKGEGVMMDWEAPLMVEHAIAIAPREGLDVLNIGFGLGLVDEALQKQKPRSHTIIEAHPDVYKKMVELGWDQRPGVKVIFGRWQDVLPILDQYDGIFFDTYSEFWEDMQELHVELPQLLKPNGIYSFFNGLCPRNPFFAAVYREIAKVDMEHLGLRTTFKEVPIDVTGQEHWEGIRTRYWFDKTYHLPICQKGGE